MEGSREETITMNVEKLYAVWQSSQKDNNIHRPQVEIYKILLREGGTLKPIIIENMNIDDEGEMYVRTLDGRHRLTAYQEAGITEINVLKTAMADQVKAIFDL